MLAESLEAADEDTETGRVEKVHPAQVGDDVHDADGREVPHAVAQERRRVGVEVPRDLKHGAVAVRADDVHFEVLHARTPSVCQ